MAQQTPMEAIKLALEREKEAVRLYTDYSRMASDAAVGEMFRFLAEEEKKHVKLLQDEIDKETLQEM